MQLRSSHFIVYFFSIIILLFSSCKSSQPVASAPSKTPDKPTTVTPTKPVEKEKPGDVAVKLNVALIMPFDLKSNFATNEEGVSEPEIKQSSLPALSFYEGATIAVDSLKQMGKDVKLTAYDSPTDSTAIARLFSNQSLKDAGLVIGTFTNALVPVAASLAEKNGINLVLTQASSPDFLENKKNVALALPSTVTQCKEVVSTMLDKNPESNIILIYRTVKREEELAEFFRSEIVKKKGSREFREINATDKGFTDIVKYLSKTKRNLIFVVSSDEAFISPLLPLLEEQNIFGIQIIGLPTWQNFESIDFMILKNVQVNIFDNNFIDYDDVERASFRKHFISRYYTDPLPSAFNGFDLVYGVGQTSGSVKLNVNRVMEKSFEKSAHGYNFKEYNGGGMENKHISILRFNDYKLEIVPSN